MTDGGYAFRLLLGALLCGCSAAFVVLPGGAAAAVAPLIVRVAGISPGGPVPPAYAYCVPDGRGHAKPGANESPAIGWSRGPAGTGSYAIVTYDTDVPSVFTDADKEGRTIPAGLKRVDFYHWVLVDIPATTTALPEAADSNGVVPKGKPAGPTKYGVRGVNSYPGGGYDGPCPPWNDTVVHHYHFTVYALDVARLPVSGNFTGPDALRAMQDHVLAKGEVVGIYAVNPAVRKQYGIP